MPLSIWTLNRGQPPFYPQMVCCLNICDGVILMCIRLMYVAHASYVWLLIFVASVWSKSLYCIHIGVSQKGFPLSLSQTWTDLDKTLNIKCGTTVHACIKIGEKSPLGFRQTVQKCVLFIFLGYHVAFWILVLHWFRPCLKQQTWIRVPEHTPMRNFGISA